MSRRRMLFGRALVMAAGLSLLVPQRGWAAPPRIVEASLVRTLLLGAELSPQFAGEGRWEDRFTVVVVDADGAPDVAEVLVTNPSGQSVTLAAATGRNQEAWRSETATRVRIPVGPFPRRLPSEAGRYTIEVRDAAGKSDRVRTDVVPLDDTLMSYLTAPSPAYTTLKTTTPTLVWSPCPEGTDNRLTVEEYPETEVWSYAAGTAKFAAYNADHKAAPPRLLPGHCYRARLVSSHPLKSEDARVRVRIEGRSSVVMLAPAAEPTFQAVDITRATVHNTPGWRAYADTVRVVATDARGAAEIAALTVTGPDGVVRELPVRVKEGGIPFLVEASITTPESFSPPAEGPFTVTLKDRQDRAYTLTTAPVKAPTTFLEPVAPAPDAVVTETKPAFRCKGAVGSSVRVQLMWEELARSPMWESDLRGETTPYDRDGTASHTELSPGDTYVWIARSRQQQKSFAPQVKLVQEQIARARFRVYQDRPTGPKLPGRLIYGYYFGSGQFDRSAALGVCEYTPDPHAANWLGPVGISYPDLAPDGKQLLYITADGAWLDARDGSAPRRLAEGFCRDPRWSPDMKQVVFVKGNDMDPRGNPQNLDLWIVNADGTGARPLRNEPKETERFPAWSPDGKWIAFRRMPSGEKEFLWLIHPDGTGLHAVEGRAVEGYPGYESVLWGNHSWSPDGTRLLTLMDAAGEEKEPINGIGSVLAEGGLVRPIFISPPGTPTNLLTAHPEWSPDGAMIAFCSGHHYSFTAPDNETYLAGELWVMNADGSGEPVRLSFDHSRINSIRWRK